MLIDRFMPIFDVSERHEMLIHARPDRTYAALRRMDLARSVPVRLLFVLRGLPLLLRRRPWPSLTLQDFQQGGFVLLGEDPGVEIVLGVVGQFWNLSGGERPRVTSGDFLGFDRPGFAKATWNFRLEPLDASWTRISTETRVMVMGAAARTKFLRYWKVVGPFSSFIRRQALRLIKRDAEAGVPVL